MFAAYFLVETLARRFLREDPADPARGWASPLATLAFDGVDLKPRRAMGERRLGRVQDGVDPSGAGMGLEVAVDHRPSVFQVVGHRVAQHYRARIAGSPQTSSSIRLTQ